jgi:pyruvate/2-oxoacid:ferredoxin oxidoreductase beta subunit
MTQVEAFLVALALLAGATFVARKYLSGDARVVLALVAAIAHLA